MPYIGAVPVSGDNSFRILDSISSFTQTFDGSSSATTVSVSASSITLNGHRFITGQRVTYSTTGTAIGGLTSGTAYYIIKVDQNTIRLATSLSNANNNNNITFTALGVGTTHTLNVAFDGINTKFKATYNNGTKAQITRAAQLQISVNGVLQQPNDTATPTDGFGIDTDSTIVFSVPPANTDSFWGNVIANNYPTFDTSDNTVDSFTGDGTTTNFALSKTPVNNQNILVTINGVVQYPNDASTVRAYNVIDNILTFVSAPGNGSLIQVRHIGFAGATSSAVTGFYGRTGNVTLTTNDDVKVSSILVGTATSSGTVNQRLQVVGGSYISGNLGIGITNPPYNLTVSPTGTPALSGLTSCVADFTAFANNYTQINIRNSSTGNSASADFVVTADNGSDTTNFIDLGINNSGFSTSTWTINGANDGYLYTSDGNLSIGAAAGNRYLSFFTGGTLAGNERIRVDSSGRIGINSTSPTSLLTVNGDVLISGVTTSNAYLIGGTSVISNTRQLQNIASLDSITTATIESAIANAPNTFTDLQVTGVSTFTNGPVLIGTGTSTGTATQRLQVSGGAYVSGNLGVGVTNPSSNLHIYGSSTNTQTELLRISGGNRTSDSFETGLRIFTETSSANSNRHLRLICHGQNGFTFQPWETSTGNAATDRNILLCPSGGNLGIGTNNPGTKLHLYQGSGDGVVRITTAYGTGTEYDLTVGGNGNYSPGVFAIRYSTNGTTPFIIEPTGHVTPGADATQNLGSASKRWANIYSADLQLSNEGSQNDVDGTWGQYTIQEGENDLFLLNRRNGKKYKFVLQEVN